MRWKIIPAIGLGCSLLGDTLCFLSKPNFILKHHCLFFRRRFSTAVDAGYSFEEYDSKRVSFEPSAPTLRHTSRVWPNYYSNPSLDRDSKFLKDEDALLKAVKGPNVKVVVIWKGRNMFREKEGSKIFEAVKFEPHDILSYLEDPKSIIIFLGSDSGLLYFAVDVSHLPEIPIPNGIVVDQLRSFGGIIDRDEDAGLLAQARGMAVWHRSERFCSACGSGDLQPTRGGSVRACRACKQQFYPRIDPSIIALVTARGGEYALLGRKAAWPPGRSVNPLLHQQLINMFDYHSILHQQFINMFDYLRYFESKSVLNSTTEIVLEWTQIQPVGGVR